MTSLPRTPEFFDLAKRIIWFETPEEALENVPRFLAYAFRYATFEDMKKIRNQLADDDLRDALVKAPPGIIDARSWSYWHAVLGIFPAPAMPSRVFGI